jgi:diaminohydroxyphosphoribosylaminopyrimidine deaminase/5-amino-6-(5-phosphoribosylamino)uracil reductase
MSDEQYMKLALSLAKRGRGLTSPNPMVGAVLVRGGRIIGRGWHRGAGLPHAEIEALNDCRRNGRRPAGATLFVTLEPCCTHGRTPPCTDAIVSAGIRRVVAGATDPNPRHRGEGFALLRRAGILVQPGVLAEDCEQLNEAFNHWIVHRLPFVTVKAAMTLDGKIATAGGQSKWITGDQARLAGMRLRQASDAILVGINTILADNPSLTYRGPARRARPLRRIVLDSKARTPVDSNVVSDTARGSTLIVVGPDAPPARVAALARQVDVLVVPFEKSRRTALDLGALLRALGSEEITSLLVEGGGEVNASFLLQRRAQRIAFFYAPMVLGGRRSRPAVGGAGFASLDQAASLQDIQWRRLGADWMLTARIAPIR